MAALDPAPPDPDGLLPTARERLAAAEQERKLAALYAEALRLLDAGQPEGALRQFEAVQALAPAYRQVSLLLARARQELDASQAAKERAARAAASPPPPAARPGKPATLPEEIKPRPKPKDLPK